MADAWITRSIPAHGPPDLLCECQEPGLTPCENATVIVTACERYLCQWCAENCDCCAGEAQRDTPNPNHYAYFTQGDPS